MAGSPTIHLGLYERGLTVPEMTVLVPSRGRPGNVARLIKAIAETATADTHLHVIADQDDPALPGYLELAPAAFWHLTVQTTRGLGRILNAYAPFETARVVGNMGDDHLPRTPGWDQCILTALQGVSGVAYGDDLLQSERLPTAAFLTSDIIECLGFYNPPGIEHLYVDNFWLHLGKATTLRYLPGVVIEHLHPHAGKAPLDAGYEDSGSSASIKADRKAWRAYLTEQWPTDLAKLEKAGLADGRLLPVPADQ